jgi:hypothetical protein
MTCGRKKIPLKIEPLNYPATGQHFFPAATGQPAAIFMPGHQIPQPFSLI